MKNLPALVLAAGRGERMRPLTDVTPKPLLQVRGQPLLHWHLAALARASCPKVVINTAWLGEQIPAAFGASFGGAAMPLLYSEEQADFGGALETAGGIVRALPKLLDEAGAFWLVAGDVYVPEFEFEAAQAQAFLASDDWAHLWLVPNPAHNPLGDFGMTWVNGVGRALNEGSPRHTYSTIGLFKRDLFQSPWCDIPWGNPQGVHLALAPLLRQAVALNRVGASLYEGAWTDVGTPARLAELHQLPPSISRSK
jgi:MurNAc alpha-1-phosphate uridylyltransferase